MTKNTKIVLGCLLLVVIIAVVPLLTIHNSEFGGADGAAEDLIGVINPGYEAWASPILEPPGGETESLLFCLQAGLGAGIVGFCFGFLVARKKFQSKAERRSA